MLPEELAGYKTLFMQTAWDYLRSLESNLFILKSDPKNAEAIESIHISAHSLKSQSLVMKFESLGGACRELEYFFRDLKEGKRVLSPETLLVLQEAVEKLKDALSSISAHDEEIDLKETADKLRALYSAA